MHASHTEYLSLTQRVWKSNHLHTHTYTLRLHLAQCIDSPPCTIMPQNCILLTQSTSHPHSVPWNAIIPTHTVRLHLAQWFITPPQTSEQCTHTVFDVLTLCLCLLSHSVPPFCVLRLNPSHDMHNASPCHAVRWFYFTGLSAHTDFTGLSAHTLIHITYSNAHTEFTALSAHTLMHITYSNAHHIL